MGHNILACFKTIKTFIFDVDGVLTDGRILINENNEFLRTMSVKDGYALQKAVKKGYLIVIISGGSNNGVVHRLNALGIEHVVMGRDDKDIALNELVGKLNIDLDKTLYMGDDVPDLKPMSMVRLPTCPSDAAIDVLEVAHYVSAYNGGMGCVRDVIEKVLRLNGDW